MLQADIKAVSLYLNKSMVILPPLAFSRSMNFKTYSCQNILLLHTYITITIVIIANAMLWIWRRQATDVGDAMCYHENREESLYGWHSVLLLCGGEGVQWSTAKCSP